MLGIGSYAFRWSGGIADRHPSTPISPAQILDVAEGLGVRLVQFADNIPLHTRSSDEIDALAKKAAAMGMVIELGMTGCEPGLFQTYLDLARRLDAKLLRIAPSAEESKGSDQAIADLFRALMADVQRAGVTLAIENHFHLPSPRLVRIVEMVDHPSLGVCLDVANSIACQEWPFETIEMLAPLAVNLHLKDFRIALDPHGVGCAIVGTPLGAGEMDIGRVLRTLEAAGRQVNVILEHWLPWQGSFEQSRQAELDWLAQTVSAARAWVPLDHRF
ncbi:MAG: sugar phosphate isomerase/epimerase [Devosia sp.]|uniref:sugar phosphate isomerase/epimerase family protein n=1 Tax=Devosia sp. TaxID=1871048 RepID=UPI0019DE5AEF|nr:sugar phosphate isomerase/epimerase family protein [Devosia sp.]MBF0680721.1 sugar phosphate isomerase/epimerase [Devosia sp.]